MKHTLLFGGLGLVLLLAYADTGYGQKKKPAKDEANKATPEEYKQLQKAKEVEGKLGSADAAAGRLYIELNAKEFELKLADKVSVRKMVLGVEYDNEGNVITRTKADIAKLRGTDPKVPGYAGKMDDLKSGQYVHLYLTPGKVDKDAKTDDKEGVGNVARPIVRMIVILQEQSGKVGPTKKK